MGRGREENEEEDWGKKWASETHGFRMHFNLDLLLIFFDVELQSEVAQVSYAPGGGAEDATHVRDRLRSRNLVTVCISRSVPCSSASVRRLERAVDKGRAQTYQR